MKEDGKFDPDGKLRYDDEERNLARVWRGALHDEQDRYLTKKFFCSISFFLFFFV